MENKAQVTAFIILGLFIITVILVVLWLRPDSDSDGQETQNPNSFLSTCLKDYVIEAVEEISVHGGYSEPELSIDYEFEGEPRADIGYLCYQGGDYLSCVNQEPMLFNHLESEIGDYISRDVRGCFDELTVSFEEKGYVVDAVYRGFEVGLSEKKIQIDINAEITLTKSDESAKEENFRVSAPSRFYDLAVIAQKIVSREARNCDFDFIRFMDLYPEYSIDMTQTLDSSKIYTVTYKDTEEWFRFAVRGCVIPPGY
jgi:hypothetical protein